MKRDQTRKPRLIIRRAQLSDTSIINDLLDRVYPDMLAWDLACIKSQIEYFPDGQLVAVFDEKIVGYSACIMISGDRALKPHTWDEISGYGYATTHDPKGNYLYGIETCVDRDYRNHNIGHRLYNKRKELCIRWHLNGIITGGRLNLLAQEINHVKTPEKYIEMVQMEKIHDHTLLFQLHNGFEVIGVLKDYLLDDEKSMCYASHLIWHN